MLKYSNVFLVLSLLCLSSCFKDKQPPLISVRHIAPQSEIPKTHPYRKMAYYRTEVKNLTDKPIKIINFEGYGFYSNQWHANNILDKKLDSQDFSNWYGDGDDKQIINGVIPAGKTAVCDVNWHGSSDDDLGKSKWSYTAQDEQGKKYTAEAIVDPKVTVIRYQK